MKIWASGLHLKLEVGERRQILDQLKISTMNCAGKLSLVCLLVVAMSVQADTIQDGNASVERAILLRQSVRRIGSGNARRAGLYYSLGIAKQRDGQRAQVAWTCAAIMLDPRMVDARMALSGTVSRREFLPFASLREFVAERAPLKVLLITGPRYRLAYLLFVVFREGRALVAPDRRMAS